MLHLQWWENDMFSQVFTDKLYFNQNKLWKYVRSWMLKVRERYEIESMNYFIVCFGENSLWHCVRNFMACKKLVFNTSFCIQPFVDILLEYLFQQRFKINIRSTWNSIIKSIVQFKICFHIFFSSCYLLVHSTQNEAVILQFIFIVKG